MADLEAVRASILAQMGYIETSRCKYGLRPCTIRGCPRVDQNIREKIKIADSVDAIRKALEDQLFCHRTYFDHCFPLQSPR